MKNRKIKIIIVSVLVLFSFSSVNAYYKIPNPQQRYVVDQAGVLKEKQVEDLESKLEVFKKESSNEVTIVIINSLEGDSIENFAVKLFEDWGIGEKKKDNGVLLLIAVKEQKMRIEVGYGLEGALTDAQCGRIIRNNITPYFKEGNYYEGINKGIEGIISSTKGEYKGDILDHDFQRDKNSLSLIIFFFVFGLNILIGIKRYLAKSRSWWQGGVLGLVIGVILFLTLSSSSFVIIIVFTILGLLFDLMVSRLPVFKNKPIDYNGRRGRGGGIFFGGGGFGGSSGGGFGGGMSGGGGASGSW